MAFVGEVRKSFEDEQSPDYATSFLSEALASWRDREKSASRTTTLLLLTCSATELIIRGATTELSIAGVKITQLGLLNYALPVVIAYLYSSLMSLAAESAMNETGFRAAFQVLHQSLWNASLERILYPANSTFLTGFRIREGFRPGSVMQKLVVLAPHSRIFVLMTAPIAYEAYLFFRLFDRLDSDDILLWISFGVASILVLAGMAAAIAAFRVWEGEHGK